MSSLIRLAIDHGSVFLILVFDFRLCNAFLFSRVSCRAAGGPDFGLGHSFRRFCRATVSWQCGRTLPRSGVNTFNRKGAVHGREITPSATGHRRLISSPALQIPCHPHI